MLNTFKKYSPTIPHLAIVHAKCVIINMEMTFLVRVRITKQEGKHNIFPVLENLNGSFAVLPSSLSRNKDFCHLEPLLYHDREGRLFEMRKFVPYVLVLVFTCSEQRILISKITMCECNMLLSIQHIGFDFIHSK